MLMCESTYQSFNLISNKMNEQHGIKPFNETREGFRFLKADDWATRAGEAESSSVCFTAMISSLKELCLHL
jgi:hypothetical protein